MRLWLWLCMRMWVRRTVWRTLSRLQLWRVNLRRNRANLRDDAAMHLSFAREKIRCATWSSYWSLLLDKVEEDRCRSGATPRAPLPGACWMRARNRPTMRTRPPATSA